MSTACPDVTQLQAFARGELGAEDLERVARHLVHCDPCRRRLEAEDSADDELLRRLRTLAPPRGEDAPPEVPGAWKEAVRSCFPAAESGAEFVADAGRTLALALLQGPRSIGRFELLEELGSGSFGYVFRAKDTELDRIVAIKVHRGRTLDHEERERFHREARSAASLKHPRIVSVYETGHTEDGALYLVTEYIAGETLSHRILRQPFDPRAAARLIAEAAEAAGYAHRHGVIHRDIHPGNILLDTEDRPHLLDFGLAKREVEEETVTDDGTILGTPAYMSPEQARGESHDVDERSDVYSLGVILYELLTGNRPFQGSRRMVVLQVLEDEPRPPHRIQDQIPRALETICLKAMSKEPGRRYETAAALAEDLQRFLRGEPVLARPLRRHEKVYHWCRANPVAASMLLVLSVGPTLGLFVLAQRAEFLVRQTALDSARMQSIMLEEVNALYSDIVFRLDSESAVEITHDYQSRAHAVPLPATFTIEAGQRISATKSGMRVQLYSDHPFPWREHPLGAFETTALEHLREDPSKPYYEFGEAQGGLTLRYATARTMKQSCLGCHNAHPDSPKRDWKEGDVRGVLEILRPLDQDTRRIREGLRGTFLTIGLFSALLLTLTIGLLHAARARRRGAV